MNDPNFSAALLQACKDRDWERADRLCARLNAANRKCDKLTDPEHPINLLVAIIIEPIRIHERYGARKFVRRRDSEMGYHQWAKAEEAERFLQSARFRELLGAFGIDHRQALAAILKRCKEPIAFTL